METTMKYEEAVKELETIVRRTRYRHTKHRTQTRTGTAATLQRQAHKGRRRGEESAEE